MTQFIAIIWPPALSLVSGIVQEISKQYVVGSVQRYSLDNASFKKFMFSIYKPDKTPMSRIKKKYKAMKRPKRDVVLLSIEVPDPTMLPHKKTRLKGTYYCQEMKRLKKVVREKFSSKIKGYIYDVMIHISDNRKHNKRTNKLIAKYGKACD